MLFGSLTYIGRYRQIRKALSSIQNAAVATIPASVFRTCGKRLGILQGKTLVLDTEDESSVLMDYCIYDGRQGDVSVVERYLIDHPPRPGTDEEMLAEPIKAARYTLLTIRERTARKGVEAWDEFRKEVVFITDEGFSLTARLGLPLATRLVRTPEYTMTTGAALPLPEGSLPSLWEAINAAFPRKEPHELPELPLADRARLSAMIIRTALQSGASQRIGYLDPEAGPPALSLAPETLRPVPPLRALRPGPPPRLSPNSPCYCGSGRKFKNCCGKPRRR
jgi:hypothetical protein